MLTNVPKAAHGIVATFVRTIFAQPDAESVKAQHTAKDFLSFMKKVVRAHPEQELHVILDNSPAHGTPEIRRLFFGILGKQSLFLNDFKSRKALADHIRTYMKGWNKNPTPFQLTKPARAIIQSTHGCSIASRRRCTG